MSPSVFETDQGALATLEVLERLLLVTVKGAGFDLADVTRDKDFVAGVVAGGAGGKSGGAVFEALADALETGGVDFLAADANLAMILKKRGIAMEPFLTMQAGDWKTYMDCLFVRKGDKGQSLADLRNARLAGWGFDSLRKILFDAGVDQPVHEFFRIEKIEGTHQQWIDALNERRIDGICAGVIGMSFVVATNPAAAAGTVPLACLEGTRPYPVILRRANMPPETLKKITGFFTGADGASAVSKQMGFFMKTLRWKFKLADEEWKRTFNAFLKFNEDAEKRGWTAEPTWNQ
ncbi:MAG: PhnD/SsuA/transferrin family substrate-binding protein [bacterium]